MYIHIQSHLFCGYSIPMLILVGHKSSLDVEVTEISKQR